MNKILGCIWGLIFCIIISLFCSCGSTKYVSVPEYHFRDSTKMIYQHDSIYMHDSVYQYKSGDTMFIDRWHNVYKQIIKHDSVGTTKQDSIKVPYPVDKIVTVIKMNFFQKIFFWAGLLFTSSTAIFLFIKFRRKF